MKKTKKKEKCESCCDEEARMYFCPKCKSHKVGPVQGWRNAFGIIPKWHCDNCGFENMTFPILVVDAGKLRKLSKKNKKRRKRK